MACWSPNRHESSDKYRYGFQGQEKDDEIKGEGNSINYKFRMHDPRVGRFFAPDPLTKEYPHYSPYSFSGNKVIAYSELEGMEESFAIEGDKIISIYGPRVDAFETIEMAQIGQAVGMHSPSLLNSYMESLDYLEKHQEVRLNIKEYSISRELTVAEKYPHHFPGVIMGSQMAIAAREIIEDAILGGIIIKAHKAYKFYKGWKKAKLAMKAVESGKTMASISGLNEMHRLRRLLTYVTKSKKWASGSLNEVLEKFAPDIVGKKSKDGVKMIYETDDILIKHDLEKIYFRIFDKNKKQYLKSDGTIPSGNKAGLKGNAAKDFERQQTHIKNLDDG
jgi:RHS repeat-associated protein